MVIKKVFSAGSWKKVIAKLWRALVIEVKPVFNSATGTFEYDLPDEPFKSDGCSGGLSKAWRALFKEEPPFAICCYDHDREYHYGSGRYASWLENMKDRFIVDCQFAKCLWQNSWQGKLVCVPAFIAVRIGGGAYWPTPYRWGFGYVRKPH